MKILFLSQLIPLPINAGPKVRIYHVLEYLKAAGHEITFVAFRRAEDSQATLDELRNLCHEIHTVPMRRSRLRDLYHLVRSMLTGLPFLIARDHVSAMHALLADLTQTRHFDAIHADQLWMAQYAVKLGKLPNTQTVLDQHNAVYRIPERLGNSQPNLLIRRLLKQETKRLFSYEKATCDMFDHVVWVTDADRQALGYADATNQHVTIPICVDPESKPAIAGSSDPYRITFLGGLHWPPNAAGVQWFLKEIWPQVTAAHQRAVLTIIGKDPNPDLVAHANEHVQITGYVDNPQTYLEETAVFIVPLLAGGGMRVKIIDAWSWGLPVVSTTIGAEGILVSDGSNLILADSPASFAQAIIKLLQQPQTASQLGKNGRNTVETAYNWRQTYRQWDQIYGRA